MQASPISGQNIAITGARGFIGSRILRTLIKSGANVTALLRTGHESRSLRKLGASVKIVTLAPRRALEQALENQDILINTAYDFRAGPGENMAAFEALSQAASRSGIRRVIHASSAVVYDDWPGGKIDESSPITLGDGNGYREAKIRMENILLSGDLEVAILQPTIVYGFGSALWTTAPMRALKSGGVVLPEPCGRCAAVHVDDVVQAFVKAVEMAELKQERYLISGTDQPDWVEFYEGYRDILGDGKIIIESVENLLGRLGGNSVGNASSGPSAAALVSSRLRRIIGTPAFEKTVELARALRGSGAPHYPDQFMLALLVASPVVSIKHARNQLGYDPQVNFQQGLAEIRDRMG